MPHLQLALILLDSYVPNLLNNFFVPTDSNSFAKDASSCRLNVIKSIVKAPALTAKLDMLSIPMANAL